MTKYNLNDKNKVPRCRIVERKKSEDEIRLVICNTLNTVKLTFLLKKKVYLCRFYQASPEYHSSYLVHKKRAIYYLIDQELRAYYDSS